MNEEPKKRTKESDLLKNPTLLFIINYKMIKGIFRSVQIAINLKQICVYLDGKREEVGNVLKKLANFYNKLNASKYL